MHLCGSVCVSYGPVAESKWLFLWKDKVKHIEHVINKLVDIINGSAKKLNMYNFFQMSINVSFSF